MKETRKIEELLNGFIDGELGPRQTTEVQRLLAHDPDVAQRLRKLLKCKVLVSSMPVAQAPPDMLTRIKLAAQNRETADSLSSPEMKRTGTLYLLARKLLTAAAGLVLVAVLAAVVYTILAPQKGPTIAGTNTIGPAVTEAGFTGTLELKTTDLTAAAAKIDEAVVKHSLAEHVTGDTQPESRSYVFNASRKALAPLLGDLAAAWPAVASASLSVKTEQFGHNVVVNDVRPEQLAEIVAQNDFERRIKAAKYFAVLNSINDISPVNQGYASDSGNLSIPPKPELTKGHKKDDKPADKKQEQLAHLTIVLTTAE